MIGTMDALDSQWTWLLKNSSGIIGAVTGKNKKYDAARATIDAWHKKFHAVYCEYRYGDKKKAKDDLSALRAQGAELQQALKDITTLITDQEELEGWISLGAKIAVLIGIAVITAGVGAYVEGALLVGAGWGATTLGVIGAAGVAAGAEAAVFTGMVNVIFETDHSVGHLLTSFAENWALFSAMRGLSMIYEAGVGVEAAKTVAGQAGNL